MTDHHSVKHGHARGGQHTGEYRSWTAMVERCTSPTATNYALYGGRGISVCRRWRDSFIAFLEDMGRRPTGTSLDRINPNGSYEPDNCRWATSSEQSRNKRTTKVSMEDERKIVELGGLGLAPREIAARFGISNNLASVTLYRARLRARSGR